MKKLRSSLLSLLFVVLTFNASGQTSIPEELSNSPLKDQVNYIEEHTRIYENFRAIREDIFQRFKKNISDTLTVTSNRIKNLNYRTSMLNKTIDSLNTSLSNTRTNLDDMTRTKESIKFLGMEVNKVTYNSIMWSIVVILLLILLIGFLIFKRNQVVLVNRNKDLQDLKTEFEAYRKTSREAREKMALQHFNELKRIRGE